MKNKGQITVWFSLIISILLIFTLTALEVGRIYCGKMKIRAVIHSASSSILADYNRELFERYHLLFMDPTYGTGSSAMVEEKYADYVSSSLNGDSTLGNLYSFSVDEVALSDCETITDNHMKLLKKQIAEYEKEAGVVSRLVNVGEKLNDSSKDIEDAGKMTERNAIEIPESTQEGETSDNSSSAVQADTDADGTADGQTAEEEIRDPRDVLKNLLSLGLLSLVLPEGTEISKEPQDFSKCPSKEYSAGNEIEKDAEFNDVSKLVGVLNDSAKDSEATLGHLGEKVFFCAYVTDHFSYQGSYKDSVMKCEAEYIIKGKDNDYDNLEGVVSDIIWMRMPVNYICIIQDSEKQSEVLTLATAICSATGTMPLVEIVKYLLLGCWSYGESIYEVRQVMKGDKIPFVKTPVDWNTDLKTLAKQGDETTHSAGLGYSDYLGIMLARKESKDVTYARMLDLIEKNLRRKDENLTVVNLCGKFSIQGKVSMFPLLVKDRRIDAYEHYFQEDFAY